MNTPSLQSLYLPTTLRHLSSARTISEFGSYVKTKEKIFAWGHIHTVRAASNIDFPFWRYDADETGQFETIWLSRRSEDVTPPSPMRRSQSPFIGYCIRLRFGWEDIQYREESPSVSWYNTRKKPVREILPVPVKIMECAIAPAAWSLWYLLIRGRKARLGQCYREKYRKRGIAMRFASAIHIYTAMPPRKMTRIKLISMNYEDNTSHACFYNLTFEGIVYID